MTRRSATSSRIAVRRVLMCVAALVLAVFVTGCVSKPRPRPAKKPARQVTYLDQPVLDFRRGGTGLPLAAGALPASREAFVSELLRAYAARLVLPEKSQGEAGVVVAEGSYPRLSLLHVDVSGSRGRKDYKPRQTKTEPGMIAKLEPALWVGDFAYVAEPLRYEHGEMDLRLAGQDAAFGLVKEPDGSGTLVMIDAAEGELVISAKVAELRAMLLGGARNHSKGGFWVRDVAVSVTSDHSRTVAIALRVKAMWTLLPMTFRLGGRVTVDEAFNVHLSRVFCEGEDPGGMLVAAMIGADMRKEEGRVRPLARWPNDRVELKDVRLTGGERLRLEVKFGRAAPLASAGGARAAVTPEQSVPLHRPRAVAREPQVERPEPWSELGGFEGRRVAAAPKVRRYTGR